LEKATAGWRVTVTGKELVAPATVTEIESPGAMVTPLVQADGVPVKAASSATVTPEVTAETVTTAYVGR